MNHLLENFAMPAMLVVLAISPAFAQSESTTKVEVRDVLETIVVPATVEGFYQTDMMSRLEGYVGKVIVDLGDQVNKGDVLLVLDAPETLTEVSRRKRLVEKARADVGAVAAEVASVEARAAALDARVTLRTSELNRIRSLVASGAVTATKQDEAQFALDAVLSEKESLAADVKAAKAKLLAMKAAVEVAKADLAHAEVMVDYLTIRAPFSGVVTQRNVDPGAYVRPPSGGGMPNALIQVESVDRVRVVMMVPNASAGGLDVGDKVVLANVRGREGLELVGKIARTGFGFEKGSRMMRAEVDLDNAVDPKSGKRPLRSGDYGSATITLNEYKNAAVVPSESVRRSPEGTYVMLQVDGDLIRRSVELLTVQDGRSVVSGQLTAGSVVVVNRVDLVKDD